MPIFNLKKKVTLLGISTVIPSKPSPFAIRQCSGLDNMMANFYMKSVYYFKGNPNLEFGIQELDEYMFPNTEKLMPKLRISLSKVLSQYPVLSGRLIIGENGEYQIKMNDTGIRVYEATADISLAEWLEKYDAEMEAELNPREPEKRDYSICPLATIQLTQFKCGGLSIGMSWFHVVADGLSTALFMRAWGEVHRGVKIIIPPVFSNSGICMEEEDISGQILQPSCNLETRTFRFSSNMVEQCIAEVESGSFSFDPVSEFEALSALLWKSITKARGLLNSQSSSFGIWIECRKTKDPPLPYGYFGNALTILQPCASAGELLNKDLSYAANLIHLQKQSIETGVGLPDSQIKRPCSCSDLVFCSWASFPMYDPDFGLGKPVHIGLSASAGCAEGMVFVVPGQGGRSRDVTVSLQPQHMEKLLTDESFINYIVDLS